MNKLEILASLEKLFELEPGRLSPETRLVDIESWDSMAALALIVWLEEEHGQTISGKEIRSLRTVGDILVLTGK